MYQPLGLECGHKFCADCVFTCVGKGRALGTVRAILDHVPAGAACPECRTPGQAWLCLKQRIHSYKSDLNISADLNKQGLVRVMIIAELEKVTAYAHVPTSLVAHAHQIQRSPSCAGVFVSAIQLTETENLIKQR